MSRLDLGHLDPDEWERLQELADRFEEAWQEAPSVDLADFLPPKGDRLRLLALQELIKSDLEIRWRNHQNVRLEQYLDRFPELGSAHSLPAALIYEEYRVRQLYGDRYPLEGYRYRFPPQFADLQRLVHAQPVQVPTPGQPHATVPEPPTALAPTPNQVVPGGEGYKILDRIGQGSFAEVYRGEAPGGIPVAIKRIIKAIDRVEAKRELQSLELIKKLRHPFLLATHAYWLSGERLFIVMELADGTLRDRLRECRNNDLKGIPVDELLTCVGQAARALDFLHERDVLHRDIKPENVLLLEGYVKVGDFGLARGMMQAQQSITGAGTPRYMAPEAWRGTAVRQSDQYSLALTYVELRGHWPFPGESMMEVMMAHLYNAPDLAPLPGPEQEVLRKALAKDPQQRYANCRDFAEALQEARSRELPPPAPPTAPPAREPEGAPPAEPAPEAAPEVGLSTLSIRKFPLTAEPPPAPETGPAAAPDPPPSPGSDLIPTPLPASLPPAPAPEAAAPAAPPAGEPEVRPTLTHDPEKELAPAESRGGEAGSPLPAVPPEALARYDSEAWWRPPAPAPPEAPDGHGAGGQDSLTPVVEEEEVAEEITGEDAEAGRGSVTPVVPEEPSAVRDEKEEPPVKAGGSTEVPVREAPPVTPPPRWRRFVVPALFGALILAVVALLWPRPPTLVLDDLAEVSTMNAGEARKVSIRVRRNSYTGPIRVTFPALPDGVVIPDVTIPENRDTAEAEVMVLPDAPQGGVHIAVAAQAGYWPVRQESVPMTVGPPCYHLPQGWEKADGAEPRAVDAEKRCYYDRIDVVRGKIKVRFILIARGDREERLSPDSVPTFYIMEDKVWVGLFNQTERGKPSKNDVWHQLAEDPKMPVNKDPEHPVMGVILADAHACAVWLGGQLPLPRQWDKAAGRFRKDRGEGPYEMFSPYEIFSGKDDGIAVDRPERSRRGMVVGLTHLIMQTHGAQGLARPQHLAAIGVMESEVFALGAVGTMRRGAATHDRSPFGVRDMAGNGVEWTREASGDLGGMVLRGSRWDEAAPFQFKSKPKSQFADVANDGCGFRVVLEP